jgi:hypothetical protein
MTRLEAFADAGYWLECEQPTPPEMAGSANPSLSLSPTSCEDPASFGRLVGHAPVTALEIENLSTSATTSPLRSTEPSGRRGRIWLGGFTLCWA